MNTLSVTSAFSMLRLAFISFAVLGLSACSMQQKPLSGHCRSSTVMERLFLSCVDDIELLLDQKYSYKSSGGFSSDIKLINIYGAKELTEKERNQMIYELLTLSDIKYNKFRNDFYMGNSSSQLTMDISALALSTGAAFSSGGAGPILSGISAGIQGAQGKLNSRFFMDKTTEMLVNTMDAQRAMKRNDIIKKLNERVGVYSQYEAMRDVLEYHHAGTIISALSTLAADAATKKVVAESQLRKSEVGVVDDSDGRGEQQSSSETNALNPAPASSNPVDASSRVEAVLMELRSNE